ncbi:TetR/AcrR family transcriptional regulator [Pusillimonas sp. MFBS29]|uniref:TetR/AcrR family transcriptional regulator n=1 Tax=Pusillimonas sp. MFBS29 TaxID=2886690 RepID=UPI001D0FB54E|nr:TetR/AcrR family transcriptional regulator [Pusillimonas sp. MFBS29]MCC2596996.1 TetR/AcrR family transcriptional regulator [Pusillimonas sp. MFBS29]
MARTRSSDYDNIRDDIMESAAKLFARQGYSATSIGDIAHACDCSKSRLYHYFDNKEAILHDMLTTHVDELLERCREVISTEEPRNHFIKIVKLFLKIYATSRNQHVVMLTCLDALSQEHRAALITKQRELIAFIRDTLLQHRPDMKGNQKLLRVDTMLFFGMINFTYTWYKADGAVAPEELAERAVELFLEGYTHIPAKL